MPGHNLPSSKMDRPPALIPTTDVRPCHSSSIPGLRHLLGLAIALPTTPLAALAQLARMQSKRLSRLCIYPTDAVVQVANWATSTRSVTFSTSVVMAALRLPSLTHSAHNKPPLRPAHLHQSWTRTRIPRYHLLLPTMHTRPATLLLCQLHTQILSQQWTRSPPNCLTTRLLQSTCTTPSLNNSATATVRPPVRVVRGSNYPLKMIPNGNHRVAHHEAR